MNLQSRIRFDTDSMWCGLFCLAFVSVVTLGCDRKQRHVAATKTGKLPSKWISISVEQNQKKTENAETLTERDFKELKAMLPTLVHAVPEHHSVATATYLGQSLEVNVCVTQMTEMRHLLDDANFEIQAGSHFNQQDPEYGHPIAVISDSLAKKLFNDETPIDKKIQVGSHEFTVTGALAPSPAATIGLQHQLYTDMLPDLERSDRRHAKLDHIWLKVAQLSDLEAAKEVARTTLKRNHPGMKFVIHSTFFSSRFVE